VLLEANADRSRSVRRLLAVLVIAAAHILAASRDQFIDNVIFGAGAGHQRARDFGFMTVDVLHMAVPYLTLRAMKSKTVDGRWRDLMSVDEATMVVVSVVLLWLLIMAT
jgi:hypothetical protein